MGANQGNDDPRDPGPDEVDGPPADGSRDSSIDQTIGAPGDPNRDTSEPPQTAVAVAPVAAGLEPITAPQAPIGRAVRAASHPNGLTADEPELGDVTSAPQAPGPTTTGSAP